MIKSLIAKLKNFDLKSTHTIVVSCLLIFFASVMNMVGGEPRGLSHTLGFTVFYMIGGFLSEMIKNRLTITPVMGAVCAQVFLFFGFEIFSFLAFFSSKISAFIICMFFIGVYIILARKSLLENLRELPSRAKIDPIVYLAIVVAITLTEYSEMPRLVMLSSDPDIHAFNSKQILRFASVPWTQYEWGELPLGYPTAFSALSALWSFFSFQDVRNTITIMPSVQMILAMGIIIETLTDHGSESCKSFMRRTLLVLFGIVIPLLIWPYDKQFSRYHLEGTPRLASMGFFVLLVCFPKQSKMSRIDVDWGIFAIIFGMISGFLILMNPGNTLPVLALSLSALFICRPKFKLHFAGYGIMACLLTLALIILDPFYFNQVLGVHVDALSMGEAALTQKISARDLLTKMAGRLTQWPSLEIFYAFGIEVTERVRGLLYLLVSTLVLALFAIVKRSHLTRHTIQFMLIQLACFGGIVLVFLPPIEILSGEVTSFRLLAPYSISQLNQILFIFFLVIFVSLVVCCMEIDRVILRSFAFIAILFWGIIEGFTNPVLSYTLRKNHHGSRGAPAPSDIEGAIFLENLYKKYLESEIPLVSTKMPKILIPNELYEPGNEKWLFPLGGSRVLFAYDIFPLAFYYFQGKKEYSFQNYRDKVCHSFDVKWLKEHDIQFLFIPHDNGGCIYNLSEIEKNHTILFQKGNTKIIKI